MTAAPSSYFAVEVVGGRAVAEEAHVRGPEDRELLLLVVAGDGDLRLAGAARRAIERERDRHRERVVRGDAARVAHDERRVRVALAREVRELRAEHPAAVLGEAAIDLGQRIVERACGELVELTVEDRLEAARAAAGADELRELDRLDGARAIELRDVDGAEAEGRDDRHLLELVRVVEALLSGVELEDRLVGRRAGGRRALVDGGADAAADGVLVVERPPVEEIDVVAAVHPRAGPHREVVVRALRVQVADADRLLGLAREVEERREERERRDDAALHALAPLVLAAELELGVVALVDDARSERDDVGAATGAAAQIACSIPRVRTSRTRSGLRAPTASR